MKSILIALLILMCGIRAENCRLYIGFSENEINDSSMSEKKFRKIIHGNEIEEYCPDKHLMKFKEGAYTRFGRELLCYWFFVVINDKLILKGRVWSGILSSSCDQLVAIPIDDRYVSFECGYPNSSYFKGVDNRNDANLRSWAKERNILKVDGPWKGPPWKLDSLL